MFYTAGINIEGSTKEHKGKKSIENHFSNSADDIVCSVQVLERVK